MFKTKEEIIQAVYSVLPYSDQIIELDFTNHVNEIRFTWRGKRYVAGLDGFTGISEPGIITGDNSSIMLAALLKNYWIKTV